MVKWLSGFFLVYEHWIIIIIHSNCENFFNETANNKLEPQFTHAVSMHKCLLAHPIPYVWEFNSLLVDSICISVLVKVYQINTKSKYCRKYWEIQFKKFKSRFTIFLFEMANRKWKLQVYQISTRNAREKKTLNVNHPAAASFHWSSTKASSK